METKRSTWKPAAVAALLVAALAGTVAIVHYWAAHQTFYHAADTLGLAQPRFPQVSTVATAAPQAPVAPVPGPAAPARTTRPPTQSCDAIMGALPIAYCRGDRGRVRGLWYRGKLVHRRATRD